MDETIEELSLELYKEILPRISKHTLSKMPLIDAHDKLEESTLLSVCSYKNEEESLKPR